VTRNVRLTLAALSLAFLPLAAAPVAGPSRKAEKGCVWEKLSDAKVGLEAWVQRCAFGYRKTDFLFEGSMLARRLSNKDRPEPVVYVFPLEPGETPEAGLRRIFASRTEKRVVTRCVLKSYHGPKPPTGIQRYEFVPDAAFQKELDAKAVPGDLPDPSCGAWGFDPDAVSYFETQPASGARKVLFVRAGQDLPDFDENTLRLLPER
jgi:hypothetical protein